MEPGVPTDRVEESERRSGVEEEVEEEERRWRWRLPQRRHGQPSPPQREGTTTNVSSFSENLLL